MGWLSVFFRKRDEPEAYDWAFLKQVCRQAIDSHVVPEEVAKSPLGELDYDRLTAAGDDAEEVVMEIWAVLKDAKTPGLSPTQAQEYLHRAAELLRSDIGPKEMALRLKEIEEFLRRK